MFICCKFEIVEKKSTFRFLKINEYIIHPSRHLLPQTRQYKHPRKFFKLPWNTKTIHEICPKLTIKILEQYYQRRSGVFIVDFEQILHIILVLPSLSSRHQHCAHWSTQQNFDLLYVQYLCFPIYLSIYRQYSEPQISSVLNSLSANPTKLFEWVWPFCGVGA